jgi:hypothetical protein
MKWKIMMIGSVIFSASVLELQAQNNTSPYSIIGIGDLEKSYFDRSSGMGHAGVALSSPRFFYQSNPASIAALDQHFFYFEVSARYKGVSYSGQPVTDPGNSQSSDVQFKKAVFAVKPRPHWALSVGLVPYSTTNYSFNATRSIQGSDLTADAYYQGSGGVNQFYVTNSFNIGKNFHIGLQTSYLFGQLLEEETLSQGITDSTLYTRRNIYIGSPMLKLGLQYKLNLSKQLNVAVGATASNQTKLRTDYSLLVKDGNTTLINNEYYKSNYFSIPLTYTGGLAIGYKNAYTLAFDYTYQGWSDLNYKGINYALVNSQRYATGLEYSKKTSFAEQAFERYFLQTGFFYNNSYLRIGGQQLKDIGATFGAGVVLARSGLGLQGAIEIGQRGTSDYGLIKEKYTQFTFTLSYRDFWFSRKMKKYD